MRHVAGGLLYVAAGILAGSFSAYVVIERAGTEAIAANGPWLSRAEGLAGEAGIYVRSHYMIEGRLPPALGQLIESTAETDSDGQTLSSNCRYILRSSAQLPKWWSISTLEGGQSSLSRQATVDADTVIHEAKGEVVISVSRLPQPGNWVKGPDARSFTLLYSAAQASSQAFSAPPFTIERGGC
jgi:hypothetical protein